MTLTLLTQAELLAQPADDYMSDAQQQFFRTLLLNQRGEQQARIAEELETLRERETSSDPADIGSAEEQRQWQLRHLERERKLLDKIDQALAHLARGEYGWCIGSVPVSSRAALLRQMAPGKARDAGNGGPLPSPATPHGAICRATLRAGPVFVRCCVSRRLFGTPNHAPRALPRAKTGSGAAATKREQTLQPASRSASSACCCGPPPACASKPRNARNSGKNTCATVINDGDPCND